MTSASTPPPATGSDGAEQAAVEEGAAALRQQFEAARDLPLEERTAAFEKLLEQSARQLDRLPRS